MNLRSVLSGGWSSALLIPALLCSAVLTSCRSERTYEVRGRVAGFGDDGRTVLVEHEAIYDFMSAMTMAFSAVDSSEISGLGHGDAIAFQLTIRGDSAWISDVQRLPDDALPEHPAGTISSESSSEARQLDSGDLVPPVIVTTHADTALTLAALRGRPVIVTFIYTRCPLPEFCPLMSSRMARLQKLLGGSGIEDAYIVSISIDPESDTPDVLREYAKRCTSDLSNWTFATGDADEIREIARLFGVFYMTDDGQITHNLTTALIGPDGRIRRIWRGSDWTEEDVLESIRQIGDA